MDEPKDEKEEKPAEESEEKKEEETSGGTEEKSEPEENSEEKDKSSGDEGKEPKEAPKTEGGPKEEEKIEPEVEKKAPEEESEESSDEEEHPLGSELIVEEANLGVKSFFNKKTLLLVLVVAAIVSLVTGGILVYRKAIKKQEDGSVTVEITSSPAPLPTTEPTPEEEAEVLKREDLKVQVLNGTGEPGGAGAGQSHLEGLGYQSVGVGNAPSYDYEEAEISLKEGKEEYRDLLAKDLAEKYLVSEEKEVLEESSEYDAIITLGNLAE